MNITKINKLKISYYVILLFLFYDFFLSISGIPTTDNISETTEIFGYLTPDKRLFKKKT